ncbi:helix-turn-helix transcriptional regulator [Calycomorphotria hydatis]|uniref:DNA-binding protein n=1 Tax=Calycomorphotria hydatis TaxID=2528027 RepID=A0A517T4R2_9PLAN|nr:hypothetical protein [Calycomorphotria hydatis]QDT63365.1 hypothetical protein V22_05860 [Calycomorphotria hydatis]
MNSYRFSFWIDAEGGLTDELVDQLYEAGCDDALVGAIDDHVYLDFDREAPSIGEAISSAIRDIRSAGCSVIRFRGDYLVSASQIAERIGRSRASITQLIKGQRGDKSFPVPLTSDRPLWVWDDVEAYFNGPPESESSLKTSYELAMELCRLVPNKKDRNKIFLDIDPS